MKKTASEIIRTMINDITDLDPEMENMELQIMRGSLLDLEMKFRRREEQDERNETS